MKIDIWGNDVYTMYKCEGEKTMIAQIEIYEETAIVQTKIFQHKTLEERAVKFAGNVGPYEEFEWGEPVGREYWQAIFDY